MKIFICLLKENVNMDIIWVSGQLVPKSTRTLVNSYLFLVNSYLSQLVPWSTRTLVKKNLFWDKLNLSTQIFRSTLQSMKTLDPFQEDEDKIYCVHYDNPCAKIASFMSGPHTLQPDDFFFSTVSRHSLLVLVRTISLKQL